MKKIIFVCTGNTCRSPMAEGIFNKIAKENQLDIFAESAGLFANEGESVTQNAVLACKEKGIDISGHKSRQLTEQLAKTADFIVPMTQNHREICIKLFKETSVLPALDIPDPYGGELDVYRLCRDKITEMCEKIADCN